MSIGIDVNTIDVNLHIDICPITLYWIAVNIAFDWIDAEVFGQIESVTRLFVVPCKGSRKKLLTCRQSSMN